MCCSGPFREKGAHPQLRNATDQKPPRNQRRRQVHPTASNVPLPPKPQSESSPDSPRSTVLAHSEKKAHTLNSATQRTKNHPETSDGARFTPQQVTCSPATQTSIRIVSGFTPKYCPGPFREKGAHPQLRNATDQKPPRNQRRRQVHPTASSMLPCHPNLNVNRLRIHSEVLSWPILGKRPTLKSSLTLFATDSVAP
jgi:hypothetical protein